MAHGRRHRTSRGRSGPSEQQGPDLGGGQLGRPALSTVPGANVAGGMAAWAPGDSSRRVVRRGERPRPRPTVADAPDVRGSGVAGVRSPSSSCTSILNPRGLTIVDGGPSVNASRDGLRGPDELAARSRAVRDGGGRRGARLRARRRRAAAATTGGRAAAARPRRRRRVATLHLGDRPVGPAVVASGRRAGGPSVAGTGGWPGPTLRARAWQRCPGRPAPRSISDCHSSTSATSTTASGSPTISSPPSAAQPVADAHRRDRRRPAGSARRTLRSPAWER